MNQNVSNSTVRQFLNQAGIDPGIILVHVETCNSPSHGRPKDQTRYLGFDQHVYADVLQDCQNMLDFGVCPMFNTYKVGGWENQALVLYLKAMAAIGLQYMINVDKGVYQNTPSAAQAIKDYIAWLRVHCFSQPNYLTDGGRFVLTLFVNGDEDPAMFAAIVNDPAYQDILFVFNDPRMGRNTMWWITQSMAGGLDSWCRMAAQRGGMQIPGLAHGFNDTFKGQSVWGGPARVWGPPSLQVLTTMRDTAAKYYGPKNQPKYFQLVTWNDCDEGTFLSPKKDGTGSYFSPATAPAQAPAATLTVSAASVVAGLPVTLAWTVTNDTSAAIDNGVANLSGPSGSVSVFPTTTTTYTLTATGPGGTATATATVIVTPPPPTVTHGEIWMDGAKLCNLPVGASSLHVQRVFSDGTHPGIDVPITI